MADTLTLWSDLPATPKAPKRARGAWLESAARFSPCGTYRYELRRVWDTEKSSVLWLMLNPSTADAETNDNTICKCEGFSRRWGYGSLMVCNLFALRSTDPKGLKQVPHPVGEENDAAILAAVDAADRVIAAWGNHGDYMGRAEAVKRLIYPYREKVYSLAVNKNGSPKHPLYVGDHVEPEPFFGER